MSQPNTPQANRRYEAGFFPIYASFALLLIVGATFGGLFYLNSAQEAARDQLVEQIDQKAEDLQPKVLDKIIELGSRLKNAQLVLSAHTFSQHVFSLLEKDTHPQVYFTNFTYAAQTNKLTMAGKAANYGVLARQIAFFEGNPMVDMVEFGGLSVDDKKHVNFSITLSLKPGTLSTRP